MGFLLFPSYEFHLHPHVTDTKISRTYRLGYSVYYTTAPHKNLSYQGAAAARERWGRRLMSAVCGLSSLPSAVVCFR